MENTDQQPSLTEILTSREEPLHPLECPKCHKVFGSAPALRMHHVRKHTDKGWDSSGNFKNKKRGKPWRAGQLEKFQATMRRKAAAKHGFKKRIQIVYPEPRDTTPDITPSSPTNPYAVSYCPCCGLYLAPIEAVLQKIQHEK